MKTYCNFRGTEKGLQSFKSGIYWVLEDNLIMSIKQVRERFYYEFMYRGTRYRGPCTDTNGNPANTLEQAAACEKRIKKELGNVRSNRSLKAMIENYREELTGGRQIPLSQAFELSVIKPRKRAPGERRQALKQMHWQDFVEYMAHNFPAVDHLAAVTKTHAENYTYSLLHYGKFEQRKPGCKRERKPLSSATVTDYLTSISEVFALLADDAGIVGNPFARIPKPTMDKEPRQPFTEHELQTIRENFDPFTEPLFIIAMATALREGDICTLKWSEIDFENRVIRRSKMRKTGKSVDIPIMPQLYQYLQTLWQNREPKSKFAEYVLPEHAKMYLNNRSGVPYRIKKFLEEKCGIVTTEKRPDRTRAVSIKDLHSCRHTFCYYAGLNGVPLNVVQSIVGHMTPEMTKHYSNHASLEVKREKMQLLPDFMQMTGNSEPLGNCSQDPEILHLLQQIPRKYSPELRQLLDYIANNDVRAIIELRRQLVS